jgi:hypothetical protein
VTEQLLYEMHDPAAYLVPDVTANITEVVLEDLKRDRVPVTGVRGHSPPETLKATVCLDGGWLSETEMSYFGPNATARADLAADIVTARMAEAGCHERIHKDLLSCEDGTCLLRLSLIHPDAAMAKRLGEELRALYCSGPAAGGGFRMAVTPQVATASVHVSPESLQPHIRVEVLE